MDQPAYFKDGKTEGISGLKGTLQVCCTHCKTKPKAF